MIKGIFFDFNGTLYFDNYINRITWQETIEKITDHKLDFDYFYDTSDISMDRVMVQAAYKAINKPYTMEEVEYWGNYKEKQYRDYGIEHKTTILSPGAKDVLNYVTKKGIPIILCTCSIKENVDYYYDMFGLDEWFDRSMTVYDTGEYENKIEMYKVCAQRLGIKIEDALIFEDSKRSINYAIDAGVKNIVAVNNPNVDKKKEILQIIKDFTELDYSIFD